MIEVYRKYYMCENCKQIVQEAGTPVTNYLCPHCGIELWEEDDRANISKMIRGLPQTAIQSTKHLSVVVARKKRKWFKSFYEIKEREAHE